MIISTASRKWTGSITGLCEWCALPGWPGSSTPNRRRPDHSKDPIPTHVVDVPAGTGGHHGVVTRLRFRVSSEREIFSSAAPLRTCSGSSWRRVRLNRFVVTRALITGTVPPGPIIPGSSQVHPYDVDVNQVLVEGDLLPVKASQLVAARRQCPVM